jgi:hypothetical protein
MLSPLLAAASHSSSTLALYSAVNVRRRGTASSVVSGTICAFVDGLVMDPSAALLTIS